MGFWYKIKKFFGHTIDLDGKDETKLVCMAKKSGNIPLNSVLGVKPNYAAVFVVKDKITDVFFEGQYKLTPSALPVTNRLVNLSRTKKNGRSVTHFNGFVYFVNLNEFQQVLFSSYQPIFVKSKNFLGASVKFSGKFSLKIFDAITFLEALFTQFALVKGNIALEQVKLWVGENAAKKIERNKPTVEELYERDTKCFNGVTEFLNARFATIGIRINSFEVTETKLPKNIYKKVKLSYEETGAPNPSGDMLGQNGEQSPQITQTPQALPSKPQRQALPQTEPEQVNGGVYSDTASLQSEPESPYDNEIVEENEVPQTIIEPTVMKKTISYKKCLKCGAINPSDSKICFSCQKPFGKICPNCGAEVENGNFVCPKCKSMMIK